MSYDRLGLLAGFNLELITIQPQRGDIVEFELVPGYQYTFVGSSTGNAVYPYLGDRGAKKI